MASDLMRVMRLIAAERDRQDARTDGGIRRYVADDDHLLALAVLTEEVGEVAYEVLRVREILGGCFRQRTVHADGRIEDSTYQALSRELVQVAAVAIGWLEGMEASGGGETPGDEMLASAHAPEGVSREDRVRALCVRLAREGEDHPNDELSQTESAVARKILSILDGEPASTEGAG